MQRIYSSDSKDCQRTTYEAIDVMKLLCSILVVAIHVPPFGLTDSAITDLCNRGVRDYIARIAVPFFFMCTGFLVFRKIPQDSFGFKNTLTYVKKIYRLYISWTIVYSPFIVLNILADDNGIWSGIVDFLKDFIFEGSFLHLWYLNATVFAVLLISILLHIKIKPSWIIGVSSILYLIGLLPQRYFEFLFGYELTPVITFTRNGLFNAILFIGLGMALAYKPIQLSKRQAIIGFSCSAMLWFLEFALSPALNFERATPRYLFLIPTAFFLFYITIHVKLKPRRLYQHLRLLSSLIFYIHLWLEAFANKMFILMGIDGYANCLQFFTVLILSIIISQTIISISRYRPFRWVRILYS